MMQRRELIIGLILLTVLSVNVIDASIAWASEKEHTKCMKSIVQKQSSSLDLARACYLNRWLHHPVLGDPSWDAFQREVSNPIYIGKKPYAWPVNGFLFQDPPTSKWYVFISLYPYGYWPPAGDLVMGESEAGGWEELGLALKGDPKSFDGDGMQPGGTVDASLVYESGKYHMVYGWANPSNTRGGLAYAWSDRPEGPYHRENRPIHEDTYQQPLLGRYVRAYASTLIRRKNDWLIVHMMSTPHNAGGTWALACMAAKQPEGPYGAPKLLLYPQSNRFHPPLAEFYPAFVHDGFIYAPATSVALNRTFQVMFRAPVEEAQNPSAWKIYQYGSIWHAEPYASEAYGIWGQTFSGQVSKDGLLRVMYPSLTNQEIGTISLARRTWNNPYHDGFVLSAPKGPAVAILRNNYKNFQLRMAVRTTGSWALCWGCRGPLGPDCYSANATLHTKMRSLRTEWRRSASGWSLVNIDENGITQEIAHGSQPKPNTPTENIAIRLRDSNLNIKLDGKEVWSSKIESADGRLELYAEPTTILYVDQFELSGRNSESIEPWLATEALVGAAVSSGDWQLVKNDCYRYGFGYISCNVDSLAKWNYIGSGFRLYSPRGPEYGECKVSVDGKQVAILNLNSPERSKSAVILEHRMSEGYHCVAVQSKSGVIPLDVLEVIQPAFSEQRKR